MSHDEELKVLNWDTAWNNWWAVGIDSTGCSTLLSAFLFFSHSLRIISTASFRLLFLRHIRPMQIRVHKYTHVSQLPPLGRIRSRASSPPGISHATFSRSTKYNENVIFQDAYYYHRQDASQFLLASFVVFYSMRACITFPRSRAVFPPFHSAAAGSPSSAFIFFSYSNYAVPFVTFRSIPRVIPFYISANYDTRAFLPLRRFFVCEYRLLWSPGYLEEIADCRKSLLISRIKCYLK